jgi:pimeloyl-ACP methyl ester carboxylesterase
LAWACASCGAHPSTEELRWQNGPVELVGTLHLPTGDGPHPAAVFLHGAGGWTREDELFRVHAERLAARGLALLIYDKRGCGASTGDWRQASFEDLARDALGAVALLREDPRIRGHTIGIFATSQGGTIALLAAERSRDIAFLATLSLSPLSAAAQERDLAERGVDISLQPTPTSRDLDPLPLLRRLELPLFAAQGSEDELLPGPRAAATLTGLKEELHKDFTIVLIPGVGHTLRPWPESYWRSLEEWLARF